MLPHTRHRLITPCWKQWKFEKRKRQNSWSPLLLANSSEIRHSFNLFVLKPEDAHDRLVRFSRGVKLTSSTILPTEAKGIAGEMSLFSGGYSSPFVGLYVSDPWERAPIGLL